MRSVVKNNVPEIIRGQSIFLRALGAEVNFVKSSEHSEKWTIINTRNL